MTKPRPRARRRVRSILCCNPCPMGRILSTLVFLLPLSLSKGKRRSSELHLLPFPAICSHAGAGAGDAVAHQGWRLALGSRAFSPLFFISRAFLPLTCKFCAVGVSAARESRLPPFQQKNEVLRPQGCGQEIKKIEQLWLPLRIWVCLRFLLQGG